MAVSLAVSLAVFVRCVCLHGAEVSNFPFRIGTLARMFVVIASLACTWTAPAQDSALIGGAVRDASVVDCPRGGAYLVTIPNVLGASGVAFDGNAILACAPEQVADGVERQVVRAVAIAGRTTGPEVASLETGAQAAVDIAVSADGVVAIADAGGAVRIIGRDGSQREIGRGVLERPSGIAWVGRDIAVSDARLRAVIVFGTDGTERRRLGVGGAGVHGTGVGSMGEPRGLHAADDGTVFVADRLLDCIWRIAADGTMVRLGERGSNPGQFRSPRDVVVRERGGTRCILVADELNHRVQIVDDAGRHLGFFGMHALIPRQGEGRIHYPVSLALAPDGESLAVAEAFEDRVQVFRLTGEPDEIDPSTTSPDFISSHFGAESGCAADLLALLDVETQGVALLDARRTPPIHISIIGGAGASPGRFVEVSALAVDPNGARVWIADAGRSRIDVYAADWDRDKSPTVDMFIPRLARSVDLVALAGRLPVPEGRVGLRVPLVTDVAFGGGRAYLLDDANLAVLGCDQGLLAGEVWSLPSAARAPSEIAVAADGRIAVADPIARRVFLRAVDGGWSELDRLGDTSFRRPSGVAFDAAGRLVVADGAADHCIAADSEGRHRIVGERGILDEQFHDPQSICTSPLGLIVVDRGNHRFQRFGEHFAWNLTGSMGRYYDRKRRGSPGGLPRLTPPPAAGSPATSGGGA